MSEPEARELVGRFVAAFNAGDHEAMLALLSDDVAHDLADGRREIGRDPFRWFLGLQARHFRETWADVAVMAGEGGGRAAAEFTRRGTYLAAADGLPPASGQRYAVAAGLFFEVDDGLITRVSDYSSLATLAAALR
ncbi:MAG: cytosolic protein [Rhizobiaceae bacterium]|nr:MAG: cytosolic protein [Rhizobiaceae bacterium]CAG0977642.1 limonene-1,2-epoxide hydrolase [Rhizobiaceae bacterium]